MTPKKQNLYKKIVWFSKSVQYEIDFFELLQPQRTVSTDPRYKSGLFYSEKCKREIQYESGKELAFIKWLEKSKRVVFYYEQPVQINYRRGRRKSVYTPDFGVLLDTKEFFIVEIKDISGMLEEKVQMKIEGLMEFCYQRGFGLLLTNGKQTIDKLKRIKCNRKLEKDILSAVNDHVLYKSECNTILKKHNASQNELLKIILKNNLKYRSYPFKLQMKLHNGNKNELFRQVFIDKKKYEDLLDARFSTLFKSSTEKKGQ